jgi:hypothetical protein
MNPELTWMVGFSKVLSFAPPGPWGTTGMLPPLILNGHPPVDLRPRSRPLRWANPDDGMLQRIWDHAAEQMEHLYNSIGPE